MNSSKIIPTFWLLCMFGLPIAVYLVATLANITGFPYDASCQPYDATTAAFSSILFGIPFAIAITVLTAMPILENNTALRIWATLLGVSLVSITLFIVYQSGLCK